MNRDFIGALLQLNAEKGVPREQLVRTVEDAIQSAYRRVGPGNEDVYVRLDIDTGKMRVFRARRVVIEIEDPLMEWTLDEAKAQRPDAEIGELIEYEELDPDHFGRVGAQIAGQVIRQRLREAERETLFDEFAHREGEIITGSVSRVEPRGVILDLGKAEAVLPTTDQSATEHYRIGQHVKAYVLEVRRTTRGPLIYVSRTHKNFLRRMFELEVRRSMPAPWRSRPSPARPAPAARSRWPAARRVSIRSAPLSASGVAASRPSWRSWAARRSTSSRGRTTRPCSSRTRCRPHRSWASPSTRTTASRP